MTLGQFSLTCKKFSQTQKEHGGEKRYCDWTYTSQEIRCTVYNYYWMLHNAKILSGFNSYFLITVWFIWRVMKIKIIKCSIVSFPRWPFTYFKVQVAWWWGFWWFASLFFFQSRPRLHVPGFMCFWAKKRNGTRQVLLNKRKSVHLTRGMQDWFGDVR